MRDTEKILHLPVYNRYADKTQVFSLYKNDDISNIVSFTQTDDNKKLAETLGLSSDVTEIFSVLHENADKIQHAYDEDKTFDLFIVLDCGDEGRLGPFVKYYNAAKQTLCIDHHVSNQSFAEENYIIPDASSPCELVFHLLDTEKITKEIAECLYTGMVHDTGVFQYSCTSAQTMNTAGILMEKGIDYPKIVTDTFYLKTYDQNRILGYALLNSKLFLDGKVIVTYLTKENWAEFHCTTKELDGIVNQLRVTKGTEVAVFLYESEDGSYKASFRVTGDVNVAEIAQVFGGGGHVKAAGCNIFGNIDTVIERILAEIKKRL